MSCEFGAVCRLGTTKTSVTLMIKPVAERPRQRWPWSATTRAGGARPSPCPTVRTGEGVGEFDYGFLLDDSDTVLPDPRSRRQPDGVHGWSRTYDPDSSSGPTRRGTGVSSPAASSTSCTSAPSPPRAPSTRPSSGWTISCGSGVDFVELMPVNAFNGQHNWGYDGVLWYAVHEGVRRPARATSSSSTPVIGPASAVIQDVVYNHLGPSGNYLPQWGPYLNESGVEHLGRVAEPGRRGLRRGQALHHRQRVDVPDRLPRRRPTAGRRARPARHPRHPSARGAGDRCRRRAAPSSADPCR